MSGPRNYNPIQLNKEKPAAPPPPPAPGEETPRGEARSIFPVVSIRRGKDTIVGDSDIAFRDFTPVKDSTEVEEEVSVPKAKSVPEPVSSEDSGQAAATEGKTEVTTKKEAPETPTEVSPTTSAPTPPEPPALPPVVEVPTTPTTGGDDLPDSSSVKKIG